MLSRPDSGYGLRGAVDGEERILALIRGINVVGSSPHSDLLLADRGVSRRHAKVVVERRAVVVHDLESKNGTFVNGERIVAPATVAVGDRVAFGPSKMDLVRLDVDDVELAIAVPAAGAAPSLTEAGRTSTLGNAETSSQLELVRTFLDRLGAGPGGDLAAALAYLHWVLGARGVAVVHRRPGAEAAVIASCGELGPLTAAARAGADTGADTEAPLEGAWVTAAGERIRLLVWGGGLHRAEGAALLAVLVRLVAAAGRPGAAAAAAEDAPAPASPAPALCFPPGYVTGVSAAMRALYREMRPLAAGDVPVLIVGETGVGKEWLAGILHRSSARAEGPLVAVNCAAIPAELAEAELFGIARGVATGVQERRGRFREADGGILFLDEVGEMPLPLQAKLLRVLQEREIQPVGGVARRVDLRVVAATNVDLEQRAAAGAFRRDLYYRLAGYVLHAPPLRACRDDVPALVERFLHRSGQQTGKWVRGITVKALRQLVAYPWPGNVRELENEIRRLVYRCADGQAIDASLLSPQVAGAAAQPAPGSELDLDARIRRLEHELIGEALRRSRGVQLRAARLLGISRHRLARKMRELGIGEQEESADPAPARRP